MIVDGKRIFPSAGYKYISNGTEWGTEACLGRSDSPDNWHDTNEEPPEVEEN